MDKDDHLECMRHEMGEGCPDALQITESLMNMPSRWIDLKANTFLMIDHSRQI